jgi:hypothetical protein
VKHLLLPSFGDKYKPYKLSRCFSLDMEKGMSPSRLLEDKFLDQKGSQQQALLLQVKTKTM